jgi:hypothetical protein
MSRLLKAITFTFHGVKELHEDLKDFSFVLSSLSKRESAFLSSRPDLFF